MTERVIDLTKKPQTQEISREAQNLEWSALEYETQERGTGWYLGIGAAALGLIIISILAQNYLFIVLVVLALAVILLYTRRMPRRIVFSLTAEGIGIGEQWRPLSDFTSFWVFDRRDTRELSLETKKAAAPFLRLPLGDADSENMKAFLSPLIPEKEHPEFLADHVARRLGL